VNQPVDARAADLISRLPASFQNKNPHEKMRRLVDDDWTRANIIA
jgi:hypothetical protein